MNTTKLGSIVAILCTGLNDSEAKWLKAGVALALECMDEMPQPTQVKVTFTREQTVGNGSENHQKISMIKFLRELNNLGLVEAKALCERITGQYGGPREEVFLKPNVGAYSECCRTLEGIASTVRSFGFDAVLC